MKNIWMLFPFLLSSLLVAGQATEKSPSLQKHTLGKPAICISFEPNAKTWNWFPEKEPASEHVPIPAKGMVISVKEFNNCNVYLNWLNPLKYEVVMAQKTEKNPRDLAVNDFIGKLNSQFSSETALASKGATDASLVAIAAEVNSARDLRKAKLMAEMTPQIKAELEKIGPKGRVVTDAEIKKQFDLLDKTGAKLDNWEQGFKNEDLTLLYLNLVSNEGMLTNPEIRAINSITEKLQILDGLVEKDIKTAYRNGFSILQAVNSANDLQTALKLEKGKLDVDRNEVKKIIEDSKSISALLGSLEISNALLDPVFKTSMKKFLKHADEVVQSKNSIINSYSSVVDLLENSTKVPSTSQPIGVQNDHMIRYFELGQPIAFEDDEISNCTITVTERNYEMKGDELVMVKGSNVASTTISFQKYDPITPTVATGIFFSNTTLKGFGVSNSGSGQFLVTEDNLKKNSPGAAFFLNFNFGKSRFLSPLLQLGIDPTKKRPFLLVGGGITIPSSRFSITGGPIWTWDQSLDKLSVGQTISSTTELDSDIIYKFNVVPKGYYLGIQIEL